MSGPSAARTRSKGHPHPPSPAGRGASWPLLAVYSSPAVLPCCYETCSEPARWEVLLMEHDDTGGDYGTDQVGPACDQHLPNMTYIASEDLMAETLADGRRHRWTVTVRPV